MFKKINICNCKKQKTNRKHFVAIRINING